MSEEDKTPTSSTAVPIAAPAEVPMSGQEKLGGKYCGCMCDYRRAVVVISIFGIVGNVILLIMTASGVAVTAAAGSSVEDDQVATDYYTSAAISGYYAIAFFFAILGYIWLLCAALKYSTCMLSVGVLFQLYAFAVSIYRSYVQDASFGPVNGGQWAINIIVNAFVYGLAIYPNVGLILEIKNGIMSKETYPREAYSCCCTPKPK